MTFSKKLLSLLLVALTLNGCAALIIGGAAGAGSIAFLEGALRSHLEAPLAQSLQATKSAVDRVGFSPVSDTSDALNAKVTARDSQGRLVEVKLSRETDIQTAISIRIGLWGDERGSIILLDEIKQSLRP